MPTMIDNKTKIELSLANDTKAINIREIRVDNDTINTNKTFLFPDGNPEDYVITISKNLKLK